MFYKLCKWLYEKLDKRFHNKMSVAAVDELLAMPPDLLDLSIEQRLYLKNRLIQLGMMDEGLVLPRPGDEFWRGKRNRFSLVGVDFRDLDR